MMKQISRLILFAIVIIALTGSSVFAQLEMNASGAVGIGGAPYSTWPLNVNGYFRMANRAYCYNTLYVQNNLWGVDYISSIQGLYRDSQYGQLDFLSTTTLKITGSSEVDHALWINGNGATRALNVTGGVWVDNVHIHSDKKLKKNIKPIDGTSIMDRINKIEGKTYNLKNQDELKELQKSGEVNYLVDTINIFHATEALYYRDAEKDKNVFNKFEHMENKTRKEEIKNTYYSEVQKRYKFKEIIADSLGVLICTPKYDKKQHFGFLAQEVEKEFPELVELDSTTGLYAVDYISFIPLLLEAVKTQQAQNQTLQALATAQEADIVEIKKQIADLQKAVGGNKKSADLVLESAVGKKDAALFQNSPNPFTESTLISYYLPETTSQACIIIYDLNGTQLKSITLHQRGRGTITIDGGDFTPGMYLYALISDGVLIDSKRMILTE